jgi:glutathione S-transferase
MKYIRGCSYFEATPINGHQQTGPAVARTCPTATQEIPYTAPSCLIGTVAMKLYYLAGSCALAPHIALEHSRLPYEAIRVDRGKQTDTSYLAINPLGRVPALVTTSHGTITEVPAVLSFIADMTPEHPLMPSSGTRELYEVLRWMAYLSSTIHPAFGRLWRAERFASDAACTASVEQAAATQLASDFAYIDRQMEKRKWVAGTDNLTVADLYLFVFGRLGLRIEPSTRDFPHFHRHTMSVATLEVTKSAMAQQGITLAGPKSGPG